MKDMFHTYLGETLHFKCNYKNRSTTEIYLDIYGTVEIHAPKGTQEEALYRMLEDKWEIIQNKSKEMKTRLNGPQEKVYAHGEPFLYIGNAYPIQVHQNRSINKDYVQFEKDTLHIHVKQLENKSIQQALKRFYYQQCKVLVEKSITFHQHHFKTKPRSIRISDSKTTWGTCDGRRQLTFNWKLAMAPLEVIDYVVVHEMCHMVHLNHDRSFWRLVGKIMPEYREKERWLSLSSWRMTV